MQVKSGHRSKFSIEAIGKKIPEKKRKIQGFSGIRTRDLRDTGLSFWNEFIHNKLLMYIIKSAKHMGLAPHIEIPY